MEIEYSKLDIWESGIAGGKIRLYTKKQPGDS